MSESNPDPVSSTGTNQGFPGEFHAATHHAGWRMDMNQPYRELDDNDVPALNAYVAADGGLILAEPGQAQTRCIHVADQRDLVNTEAHR